jgi:hypothetical protein
MQSARGMEAGNAYMENCQTAHIKLCVDSWYHTATLCTVTEMDKPAYKQQQVEVDDLVGMTLVG